MINERNIDSSSWSNDDEDESEAQPELTDQDLENKFKNDVEFYQNHIKIGETCSKDDSMVNCNFITKIDGIQ